VSERAYPEEVQALRRLYVERNWPATSEVPVEEARRLSLAGKLEEALPGPEVASVEDLEYEGPGGPQRARLYKPDVQLPPLLVYFHGGGWVVGSIDAYDAMSREIAVGAGVAVLNCDYRHAPESSFPAAAEDAEAAVRWAAVNGHRLGVDPTRMAVGGDSAGGNLAAVVAQRVRDSGGPQLAFQLLVYPVIEHGADTKSAREVDDPVFLDSEGMNWYWSQYLPTDEHGRDPRASPIHAESLAGLPSALVITAECDPLLDEGENYARRMADAGVEVVLSRYDGMPHGFFTTTRYLTAARDAQVEAAAALRNSLQRR
jgi:acetyl esterase